MILSINENNVSLQSWKREEEMKNFLSGCKQGNILLGKDTEQKTSFHSVRIDTDWKGLNSFGIGICLEDHGLEPHILLQTAANRLLIGFNSEVVGVDMVKKKIEFQIRLNSLFRCFTPLKKYGMILIFHEIGIVAVNEKGEEIWSFDRDIIEDSVFDEDNLFLDFLDAAPVTISLLDGVSK